MSLLNSYRHKTNGYNSKIIYIIIQDIIYKTSKPSKINRDENSRNIFLFFSFNAKLKLIFIK